MDEGNVRFYQADVVWHAAHFVVAAVDCARQSVGTEPLLGRFSRTKDFPILLVRRGWQDASDLVSRVTLPAAGAPRARARVAHACLCGARNPRPP